jgi:hypothetical protein
MGHDRLGRQKAAGKGNAMTIGRAAELHGSVVTSNNAFERSVGHGGPRLGAARSSWPAAQLGR